MNSEGKHTQKLSENPHYYFFEDLLSKILSASYDAFYDTYRNTNSSLRSELIKRAWKIENIFEIKSLIVLYERYIDSPDILGTPLENTLRHIRTILSVRYKKLLPKKAIEQERGNTSDATLGKVFDLMDENCHTVRSEFTNKPGLQSQVEQFRIKAFEHLPVQYNYEYIQLLDYIQHYCKTWVSMMNFNEKWIEDTLSFCDLIECQLLELHMKEMLRNFDTSLPSEYKTRLEKLHDIFAWRKLDLKNA